jgi:hypothetical protein
MRRLFLDRDTADRLLTGHVDPDDAPPGYACVAVLLGAVSSLPPIDPARERITVSAMVEEIRAHLAADPPGNRRTAARRLVRAKIVAIAIGATLVGTAGLAAAGALPPPAQGVAHDVFARVGISIPDATRDADADGGSGDVTSPEPSRSPSVAGMGAEISQLARTTTAIGVSKGAIISAVASDGHSHAGQPHGQSGQTHGGAGPSHGQPGDTHGQSDQTHGQSDQTHGSNGSSHR